VSGMAGTNRNGRKVRGYAVELQPYVERIEEYQTLKVRRRSCGDAMEELEELEELEEQMEG